MNISERLRQVDAYPKTLEDFRVKTFGGAIGTNNLCRQDNYILNTNLIFYSLVVIFILTDLDKMY